LVTTSMEVVKSRNASGSGAIPIPDAVGTGGDLGRQQQVGVRGRIADAVLDVAGRRSGLADHA